MTLWPCHAVQAGCRAGAARLQGAGAAAGVGAGQGQGAARPPAHLPRKALVRHPHPCLTQREVLRRASFASALHVMTCEGMAVVCRLPPCQFDMSLANPPTCRSHAVHVSRTQRRSIQPANSLATHSTSFQVPVRTYGLYAWVEVSGKRCIRPPPQHDRDRPRQQRPQQPAPMRSTQAAEH